MVEETEPLLEKEEAKCEEQVLGKDRTRSGLNEDDAAQEPTKRRRTQDNLADSDGRTKGLPEGLSLGARLEVKWDLEENEETESRWWGCTLQRNTGKSNDDSRPIFELLYDAYAEFKQTTAEVVFAGGKLLLDLDVKDTLLWRLEGDTSSTIEGQSTTMVEVQQAQEEVDRENGESVEQVALEEFEKLSYTHQQRMAASYRFFADKIKEQLHQILVTKGAGYEITSSDINGVMERIQAGQ